MKSGARIVHLSTTPLVSAPGRIAAALNHYTEHSATVIIGSDYPSPINGLFVGDSVLFSEKSTISTLCEDLVRRADIIHVHNDLPEAMRRLVWRAAKPDCKFVYQVHSPFREGPLYFDRAPCLGLDFSAKLTIAHFPPRFFPDYRIVPNLTPFRPNLRPLGDREKVRILFSPAHRRTGLRWGNKVSSGLNSVLSTLEKAGEVHVNDIRGVTPAVLMEIRYSTHITIDEIVTGAFHQVSLEGLAAGNVVVNNADYFAVQTLRMMTGAQGTPPFVRMSDHDVAELLPGLVSDRERIRRLQRESYEFFMEHLRPDQQVRSFASVYEEVLDA